MKDVTKVLLRSTFQKVVISEERFMWHYFSTHQELINISTPYQIHYTFLTDIDITSELLFNTYICINSQTRQLANTKIIVEVKISWQGTSSNICAVVVGCAY